MPCPSFSIPASKCKSGSQLAEIPGTICHICYARKGTYRFGNVQAALQRRFDALDHPDWVEAMVVLIKPHLFFRWFDSGDIQSLYHFYNIRDVCKQTPKTRHWLPTKEMEYLSLARPKNLVMRYSMPIIDGKPRKGIACSIVVTEDWDCPAAETKICGECRRCWDRRVKVVRYRKH